MKFEGLTYGFKIGEDTWVDDGCKIRTRVCDVCRKKGIETKAIVSMKITKKKYDLCNKHARKIADELMKEVENSEAIHNWIEEEEGK